MRPPLTPRPVPYLGDVVHVLRLDDGLEVVLQDAREVVLQLAAAEIGQDLLPVGRGLQGKEGEGRAKSGVREEATTTRMSLKDTRSLENQDPFTAPAPPQTLAKTWTARASPKPHALPHASRSPTHPHAPIRPSCRSPHREAAQVGL